MTLTGLATALLIAALSFATCELLGLFMKWHQLPRLPWWVALLLALTISYSGARLLDWFWGFPVAR